jgi:anti-sigma factor RsiW
MTHDEIQADLALLALGSLDAGERRAVEEHLAGCDSCRRELAGWRPVVDLLPLAFDDGAAPDLKPALIRRVRTARPDRRVIRLPSWVAMPLAAAAMVLLALAVVRDRQWRADLAQQRQTVASLRQELDQSSARLEEVRRLLAEREGDVTALQAALNSARESLNLLQTRGLSLVRLSQPEAAAPAEGHALIGAEAGRALFYAFGLPAVPSDKTYELWWITENEGPVNAGLFVPGPDGLGRLETSLPVGAGAIRAAAVTVEPAGGQPKPTGPMVLLGKIETAL